MTSNVNIATKTTTAAITETRMIHHLLHPLLSILNNPDTVPSDDDSFDTDTFLQLLPLILVPTAKSEIDELQEESLE